MRCLVILGVNLEDDYHLILPSVIRCAEVSSGELRRNAIITVGKLARLIDISDMSSRIVQTFVRILAADGVNSAEVVMNTFCILLLRLQADFTVFIPTINRVLMRTGTSHGVYDVLVNKLLKHEPLPETVVLDATTEVEDNSSPQIEPPVEKLPINQPLLKSTWDCSQQRTQDDWQEWIKKVVNTISQRVTLPLFTSMHRVSNCVLPIGEGLVQFFLCQHLARIVYSIPGGSD